MGRDIRRKVNTHFCVACLQQCGSVERVVCRLQEKFARCMATCIASMPDLDDEALDSALQAAAAEARACLPKDASDMSRPHRLFGSAVRTRFVPREQA